MIINILLIKGKEYRNLDGLIKFINTTLQNNKEVYFVTARQAIEWVKLIPTLSKKAVNLKEFVDEELMRGPFSNDEESGAKFDGKCLTISPADSDSSNLVDIVTKEDFRLDDTYGVKPKDLKNPKLNKTVLIGLQSEVLFLNEVVVFLVIGLAILCLLIIVYDRTLTGNR